MLRISLRIVAVGLLLAIFVYSSFIQQWALDAGPNIGYAFVYDGLGIINLMIIMVIGVMVWGWFIK
ncbi:MAG TPA: hypothetical protein PKH39_16720 [Woeseiaceae bacterium]|nr:hypothetical protein [Woeseiaceae bacterium]